MEIVKNRKVMEAYEKMIEGKKVDKTKLDEKVSIDWENFGPKEEANTIRMLMKSVDSLYKWTEKHDKQHKELDKEIKKIKRHFTSLII